jgi:hypothetical protein
MGFKDFLGQLKDKGEAVARDAAKKLAGGLDVPEGGEMSADPPSGGSRPSAPPPGPPGRGPHPTPPSKGSPIPQAIPQRVEVSSGTGSSRTGKPPASIGVSGSPLTVATPEDSTYQRRTGLVVEVEERYSRFGPKVCSYLLTQFMLPNGSKRVAEKLGLASRGFDAGDRNAIEQWLDKHGADEFCRVIGIRTGDARGPNPQPVGNSKNDPLRVRTIEQRVSPGDEGHSAAPPMTGAGPGSAMGRPAPQNVPPSAQAIASKSAAARTPVSPGNAPSPKPGITPVALGADVERRTQLTKAPTGVRADGNTPQSPVPVAGHPTAAPPPPREPTPPAVAPKTPPEGVRAPQPIKGSNEASDLLKDLLDNTSFNMTPPPKE